MEPRKRNRGVLAAAVLVLASAATAAAVAVPARHRAERRVVVEASGPPPVSPTTPVAPTTATTEAPAATVTTAVVRPSPSSVPVAATTRAPRTPDADTTAESLSGKSLGVDPATGRIIAIPSRPGYSGPVPAKTGRPPCPGTPDGLYAAGCVVTGTQGGISIELGEYGQLMQVNRDPAQLRIGQLAPQVAVRQWRFDWGVGDSFEASIPDCSRYRQPAFPPQRTYPTTGDFQITLTVTAGVCEAGVWAWTSEQTFSLIVPVRVCNRLETIDSQVYCIES